MPAPDVILDLAERFAANSKSYTSGPYNETQARREFIDPLFRALGWDMDNVKGYAEAYKEVVHEDAIKVGGATKAPDYSFRVGGVRKFFLEAKKPGVNIKDDPSPAFQLRRYAWSAKLPLSVLTDFEEFAVYDTRIKPAATDKASAARVLYLTYDQYEKRWDEIAGIFAREAVLKGSFDRYVESEKKKKGTAEVDRAFLLEIESWREVLAKNLAVRNPGLSSRDLNYAVQVTIDRTIFLRIAEDRGLEGYGRLLALANGEHIYKRMFRLFEEADDRYNSGLFSFREEPGRPAPDLITPALELDDKPLKQIIKGLYYPESPYEFSVLPTEILGQVYEQFLGKVIRLTAGHRAVVEDKPEVKKAGGVYYTPGYIVDYIVEHTVGRLCSAGVPPAELGTGSAGVPPASKKKRRQDAGATAGITPNEAASLKILDPACGSGSFLLRAYQYLLDWHREWYVNDGPEKHRKQLYQGHGGEWRLATAERKRILLNNIYGVDIDPQAVEVTKLSLLLKVLEGETEETINSQLKLFKARALPDLSKNIKCGNSLIGPDFYSGQQMGMFEEDEVYRINAFDWEKEFPEVYKRKDPKGAKEEKNGFDVVIGNPPYGALFAASELHYLKEHFATFSGRGESYILFIEKALMLSKYGGQFGYIVPDTYLNLGFTEILRSYLLENSLLREIVILPRKVFEGTVVDTTILITEKADYEYPFHKVQIHSITFDKGATISQIANYSNDYYISSEIWYKQKAFIVQSHPQEIVLMDKCSHFNIRMSDIADTYSGVKSYEVGKGNPPQSEITRKDKPFTSINGIGKGWEPFYDGKHIGRYQVLWKNNNWIKYGPWLAAPRDPSHFEDDKILIRKIIGETLIATYVSERSYCNTLLFILKTKSKSPWSLKSLLAILNSRFIGWYFRIKYQIHKEDTFPQIMIRDILDFPVPRSVSNQDNQLTNLVDRMLELKRREAEVVSPHEKEMIRRQVEATDGEIDRLVYELYGLTEEEIGIVEGLPG